MALAELDALHNATRVHLQQPCSHVAAAGRLQPTWRAEPSCPGTTAALDAASNALWTMQ
jgi:hypothetical protein